MRLSWKWVRSGAALIVAAATTQIVFADRAWAVPSYARQTGLACEACHTVFPELTPYGRLFKMNGYVFENVKSVSDINAQRSSTLSLTELPPISVMLLFSETHTQKAQPDSALAPGVAQNDTVEFPQQASIFYAGRIADNLGTFFQLTYDPTSNSIGIDNTDLRFADANRFFNQDFIYGLSLNNNPTVEDPWNSTPAWGAPFAKTNAAPGQIASALIDGGLAQNAAGVVGYTLIDKQFYIAAGGYRSSQAGVSRPIDSKASSTISNFAPYWRLAWQKEWGHNSFEIGTYGMWADVRNSGGGAVVTNGPTDSHVDTALDTQYQFIGEDNILTLAATWIHENNNFRSTAHSNNSDVLNTLRATASYYYRRHYGGSLQLFSTSGDKDPLAYAPAATTGSRSGSPATSGATFEVDYLPWLNTKLGLQYTAYLKFNGNATNYDGSGRNASDNNTLYAFIWTAF